MSNTSFKTAVAAFCKKEVHKKKKGMLAAVRNGSILPNHGVTPSAAESEKEAGAYNIEVHDDLCGCLRLDGHIIEGWIAEKSAKPFLRKLVLRIAGSPSNYPVHEVEKPVSPYNVSPPDNAMLIQTDISEFVRGMQKEGYVDISVHQKKSEGNDHEPGKVLMRLVATRKENEPLNQNPELHRETSVSISDWTIKCNDGLGLRIDEFHQNKSFDTFSKFDPEILTSDQKKISKGINKDKGKTVLPTRYSRLAFTEGLATESTLTLSTTLSVTPFLEEKELEFSILLRADRTTNLSARLVRNGKVLSCISFSAETHWTEIRRQFTGSLSFPRHKTAEYRMEIDVVHRGRGYIDVIACTVSTSPSIQNVLRLARPGGTGARKQRKENFIRNGTFDKWSRGFTFDKLESRQETADAWRIDCRKEESLAVQVALFQLRDQCAGAKTNGTSKFGLNARTQSFNGAMRLISVIGREFQNSKSIVLRLDIHTPDQDEPVKAMRRITLLGKSVGSQEVLHVIARNPVVKTSGSFEYIINEKDLVTIRSQSSKHSNILICFELQENSNIVLSSVEMYDKSCEDNRVDSRAVRPVNKVDVNFEDPGIVEQVAFLKGLDNWKLGHNPVSSIKEIRSSPSTVCTAVSEWVKPKLLRPAKKYPTLDIIVPIHNAFDAVKKCLQSIIEETTVPYTLYCIDDASDAETREWLADFCNEIQHVQLHTNEENIGYTKSVNRGLKLSTADWVCVLNSDAIVTNLWLERLVDVSMADQKIGIVSPLSNAASYQSVPRIHVNDDKNSGWSFNPLPEGVSPNDMAEAVWMNSLSAHPEVGVSNGFCQLIKREMLDEIGMLDEKSFPRGFGEENDLCARATQAGWQIRIADDTYVFHIKSQSFGHEQRVDLSKQGKMALLKKHPNIDWNEITNDFQNEQSLVELRQRLIKQGF